jgi:hypothetical protein
MPYAVKKVDNSYAAKPSRYNDYFVIDAQTKEVTQGHKTIDDAWKEWHSRFGKPTASARKRSLRRRRSNRR